MKTIKSVKFLFVVATIGYIAAFLWVLFSYDPSVDEFKYKFALFVTMLGTVICNGLQTPLKWDDYEDNDD